jgi:hypothetical protein
LSEKHFLSCRRCEMGILVLSPLSPFVTFWGVTVFRRKKDIYLYVIYIVKYFILSSILYCHPCHPVFVLFSCIFNLFPVVIGLVGFWSLFFVFYPLLEGDSGDSLKKCHSAHINTGKKVSPTFGDSLVTRVTKVTASGVDNV